MNDPSTKKNIKGRRKTGRGEIVKVGDLFSKYKNILKAPEGSVKKAFVEVVADLLQINVKENNLGYSPHTKVVSIKSGGPLKSELLLHKTEILTHLKGRLGAESAPKDII